MRLRNHPGFFLMKESLRHGLGRPVNRRLVDFGIGSWEIWSFYFLAVAGCAVVQRGRSFI